MSGQMRDSADALIEAKQDGDWFVDEGNAKVWIYMPNGGGVTSWPYRDPLPNGACWRWNGSKEKPTLEPSLNLVGYWHGWLRDGELISA